MPKIICRVKVKYATSIAIQTEDYQRSIRILRAEFYMEAMKIETVTKINIFIAENDPDYVISQRYFSCSRRLRYFVNFFDELKNKINMVLQTRASEPIEGGAYPCR